MKLILAQSQDGFLATGPKDDMKWTGPVDKSVFKLVTLLGGLCLAGRRTAVLLPNLPGRTVFPLSRNPGMVSVGGHGRRTLTLDKAHRDFGENAWLIGGAEIAERALKAGYISQAVICTVPSVLGDGIPFEIVGDTLKRDFRSESMELAGITVTVWRRAS